MPSTTRLALYLAALIGCSSGSPSPDDACVGPLGPPLTISQIDSMAPCCQADLGEAHCLAGDKVPAALAGQLTACEGGAYCVPDNLLATGASKPPASCTAFGGAGVCLSVCIPAVSKVQGFLAKDTCQGADELCAPCTDPRDGSPTGACEIAELAVCVGDDPSNPGPGAACDDPATCAYEASCPAVFETTGLTACGADAHCVDASIVAAADPAQASRLAPCTNPAQLCVPDVFLATGGKFIPKTCTSVNGAEGRCLSTAIPEVASQSGLLPQASCAASEKCLPCYSPLDGTSTGACNLSCDTGPTQPPKPFAQCCGGRARCVPTSAIPDDQEDNLGARECEDLQPDTLCVPNQILANGPFPACSATAPIIGAYTGVCLSECLDFGLQGIILQPGTCAAAHLCAPCTLFGSPTGAPGCPP